MTMSNVYDQLLHIMFPCVQLVSFYCNAWTQCYLKKKSNHENMDFTVICSFLKVFNGGCMFTSSNNIGVKANKITNEMMTNWKLRYNSEIGL